MDHAVATAALAECLDPVVEHPPVDPSPATEPHAQTLGPVSFLAPQACTGFTHHFGPGRVGGQHQGLRSGHLEPQLFLHLVDQEICQASDLPGWGLAFAQRQSLHIIHEDGEQACPVERGCPLEHSVEDHPH
jgi:hypothetical protein